ncbi:MAG: polyprenol monophosphomannose synthase [Patescibacteria group bacterium]
MKKIIIVIPTYNEVNNINSLLKKIAALGITNINILIVDDNSPDGTAAIVEKLQNKYPWVYLLKRKAKEGLGIAYRAGFHWALEHQAEVVGEMDSDLSHQPEDLANLINAFQNGVEVVIGSRRVSGGKIIGWSWWRLFTSWGAMSTARLLLRLKTKDVTSGFRLYTRRALQQIPWAKVKSSGYAWQEELIFLCERANLKIIEVPITFIDRKIGKSKLSFADVLEFFYTLIRLLRQKAKRRPI